MALELSVPAGHQRQILIETARTGPAALEVRAQLKDISNRGHAFWRRDLVVHHMVLRLEIDSSLVVRSAEFSTLKAPYLECKNHVVGADRLIGLSLAKGFTKSALEIYGGTEGCSHMLTLLTNLAPAVRQGIAFTLKFPEEDKLLTPDNLVSFVQRMGRDIQDTCMVWKKESSVQRDLAKGKLRDLPARLYPQFAKKFRDTLKKFE